MKAMSNADKGLWTEGNNSPSTSDSKLFPSTIILGEGLTSKFRLSHVVCSKDEPAIAPIASTILWVTSWLGKKSKRRACYFVSCKTYWNCTSSATALNKMRCNGKPNASFSRPQSNNNELGQRFLISNDWDLNMLWESEEEWVKSTFF